MQISEVDILSYQRMCQTPAGAILRHILKRLGMSQAELSKRTGISPQHINGMINGTRRFSITHSFKIEEVLGMEACGLLCKCQCNYDIYQASLKRQNSPDITKLRKATFWDVDLSKVDWQKGKRWAILRVLEYGCKNDFDEISGFYGIQNFLTELSQLPDGAAKTGAARFGLL